MRCHATSRLSPHPVVEGYCTWRHRWEEVELYCDETVVPGSDHCADHLIQVEQERALQEQIKAMLSRCRRP